VPPGECLVFGKGVACHIIKLIHVSIGPVGASQNEAIITLSNHHIINLIIAFPHFQIWTLFNYLRQNFSAHEFA